MQIRDLTMTAEQAELLNQECNIDGSIEGACQFLCGINAVPDDPWLNGKSKEPRLTIHRIDPIPNNLKTSSESRVSWDMDYYIKLLRKARENNFYPGICHSHPNSSLTFSNQDDANESHLHSILQRRNAGQLLISLLLRGDGKIDARSWSKDGTTKAIPVRILGRTMREFSPSNLPRNSITNSNFLHRQCLAVGEETVARLQGLRVAVVGCGGTGSAVAVLLARAGIGRLLLIDSDVVDETNLNRLHGSSRSDVEAEKLKVNVLKHHIESMGIGTKISVITSRLASSNIARVLCSCDCVFGCTDDHLGRLILNRLAYFYFIPIIDTGLAVDSKTGNATAQITGRVTTLRPGVTCLLCRGTINPERAREQGLRLKKPREYQVQQKEGYIKDDDTPTPVVGTFTTETATAAVNEFLAGFASLRGDKGWAGERTIRYDLDRCRPTGCLPRLDCSVCANEELWGLGDVKPFLELSGM